MGFKRTPEGRVFFQGADSANDESAPRPKTSNPSPQMRSPLTGEKTQGQIVTLLKTLNERLKVTQADRDNMMKELDKHRAIIEDLEGKAERSERIALDLEDKIEKEAKVATSTSNPEAIAEFEKTRKAFVQMEKRQDALNKTLVDKVTKSASGVTALKRRVESTEAKQGVIDERIEAALSEQAKIIRKVDKAIEDRARFMRKIERIEETVIQTRDSLNAKAMVVLTEQGAQGAGVSDEINEGISKYLPDDLEDQISEAAQKAKRVADIKTPQKAAADTGIYAKKALPWWKNASVTGALAGLIAFILATTVVAVLAMNDWRWPGIERAYEAPQTIAQDYSQLPDTIQEPPPSRANIQTPSVKEQLAQNPGQPIASMDWSIEPTQQAAAPFVNNAANDAANDVGAVDLNNAEQVEKLMEETPQKVAEALNEIEPQKQTPPTETVAAPTPAEVTQKPVTPTPPAADVGTKPNPTQASAIASQMQRDASLPNVIKSVEEQAFEGIGEAQHDLAAIYTAGHGGVKQDYSKAAFWFEKASENGIANASYNLGVLHHQGLGFEADVKEAMGWYKDAAAKGHPEAQYNLGIAYIEGIGVPYDPVTASNYFENAANNGVMEAAYNLGLIYENGLLGDAQPDRALLWYKTAADQGSPEAKQALNDLANTLGIKASDVNSIVDDMRGVPDTTANTPPQKETSLIQQQTNVTDFANNAAGQGIIAQIQEYLMRAGLYPGPADGIDGALTQDAIRSYQSSHGMQTDGEPSETLLGHMLGNSNQSAVFQTTNELGSRAQ